MGSNFYLQFTLCTLDCKSQIYFDSGIIGDNDLDEGPADIGKTLEECIQKCCRNERCKSIDYQRSDGLCHLSTKTQFSPGVNFKKDNDYGWTYAEIDGI